MNLARLICLSSVLCLFSIVMPATAQVYSVNALGYADINLSAGSNFISNPLSQPANVTVSNLFPTLPNGSYLRLWEHALQDFGATNSFSAVTGWSDPAARLLLPRGAVIWVPTAARITFSGELFQGGVTGRMYSAGMHVGVMPRQGFFVCGNFSECSGSMPPLNTTLCRWDAVQQRCATYNYLGPSPESPSGWWDDFGPADPQLNPGEAGVFYVPESFYLPDVPSGSGPSPAVGLQMTNVQYSGTSLTFQFAASNAAPYAIWRSTNLPGGDWQNVHEGTATNGINTVILTNATNVVAFYRLAAPMGDYLSLFNDARTNGHFRFQFYAPTEGNYAVQRTVVLNPTSWQPIASISAGAKSIVTFIDTNAAGSRGYYRIVRL